MYYKSIYVSLFICLSCISVYSQDCIPKCRSGYECIDGICVQQCNPPCPAGYTCDTGLNDCVEVIRPDHKLNHTDNRCGHNEIFFRGSCQPKKWIATTANVRHAFSSIPYVLGSAAYLFAAVGYSVNMGVSYDDISIISGIVEANAVILSTSGWLLRQRGLASQRKVLADLGIDVDNKLRRQGRIYQLAATGTGCLAAIFGFADVKVPGAILAYGSATFASIAFVKNMKVYKMQKGMLHESVYGKQEQSNGRISVYPQIGYSKKTLYMKIAMSY